MTTLIFEISVNVPLKHLKMICKGTETYCKVYIYSFSKFSVMKPVMSNEYFGYFDMHSGMHLIKVMRNNADSYFNEILVMVIYWNKI
jgi:hypothetical protein